MNRLKSRRMLVILAHPDDESFAVGGTLAKFATEGVQVVLLTATRGEAGIPGTQPEVTGTIREQELLQAAKYLGIEVFFLDYPDGELASAPPAKLVEHIACWIDTVDPQVVLTFGPDGISGHPDHVTLSHTVTKVVETYFPEICLLHIAPSEATQLGCGVSPDNFRSTQPLVSVDISDHKLEKIRAIQSHVSQHPPLRGKPEDVIDQIPCHEFFTVAHSRIPSTNPADCFNAPRRIVA